MNLTKCHFEWFKNDRVGEINMMFLCSLSINN